MDLIKIKEVEGELVTTSLNVAHVFRKEHKHVIEAIEKLDCSSEFRETNFRPSFYYSDLSSAGNRKYKKYLITKDGIAFLCMGFTGEKAAAWKELYIKKFSEMEAQLAKIKDPSPMTKLDWIEFAKQQEIEKLALQEEKLRLENKIQEDQPKVEFVNRIEKSKDSIEVGEFAKILCKRNLELGPIRLFNLMKDKNGLNLLITSQKPRQYALDNGWLEVSEYEYEDNRGNVRLYQKVMVTGKGQPYIEKKIRSLMMQ